jgi:hypothetical protein
MQVRLLTTFTIAIGLATTLVPPLVVGQARGRSGPPVMTVPARAAAVEQTKPGTRAPVTLVESFDGLGVGFEGPQGAAVLRNPSDNTLAVGPDHIVQIVNSRMAIFTKKGKKFPATGTVLYGPVPTNNVFRGFGGTCEAVNNGDAVARYDQLADRWLIVMPIFRRMPARWRCSNRRRNRRPRRRHARPSPGRRGAAGRPRKRAPTRCATR